MRQRQGFVPYQDVFEFDIPVHQALAVQVPDPFHHIQGNLQPWLQFQPSLRGKNGHFRPKSCFSLFFFTKTLKIGQFQLCFTD